MPRLFGLDIAALVDANIQAAGGVLTGTLTKPTAGTRTPGDITSGTNPTTQSYSFRGFLESRSQIRINGTLVRAGGQVLSVLGASLPDGIEPESGDTAVIEGTTFQINAVADRDPAAALYQCAVES